MPEEVFFDDAEIDDAGFTLENDPEDDDLEDLDSSDEDDIFSFDLSAEDE